MALSCGYAFRATPTFKETIMRVTLLVLGVILLITGAVWALQGLNVIKGSFMTGQSLWLWIGVVCLVLGASTLFAGMRLGTKS